MNYKPLLIKKLKDTKFTKPNEILIKNFVDSKIYETDDCIYFLIPASLARFPKDLDRGLVVAGNMYVTLLDIGIDKQFKIAQEIITYEEHPLDEIEFNLTNNRKNYWIRQPREVFPSPYGLLYRAASKSNLPNAYRKILELYEDVVTLNDLKDLLIYGGDTYIKSIECRSVLMEYINTHFSDEDIKL